MNQLVLFLVSLIFLPMAIEDFKDRSVHVFFLFLPYVSFALPFLISTYMGILSLVMASVLFLAATTLHKLNMLASGDVIVAPLVFSMPFALTYIIIAFLVIANVHIAYTYAMRGDINKLPLVGYIGLAEFVGVLCFLLLK
jgi:hypothetical protein